MDNVPFADMNKSPPATIVAKTPIATTKSMNSYLRCIVTFLPSWVVGTFGTDALPDENPFVGNPQSLRHKTMLILGKSTLSTRRQTVVLQTNHYEEDTSQDYPLRIHSGVEVAETEESIALGRMREAQRMGQSAKLEHQSLRKHANIPNFHDAKNQRVLH